jgi:hypothetical protein
MTMPELDAHPHSLARPLARSQVFQRSSARPLDQPTMSASSLSAIFQTNRTATLVPADARNKKQLRAVVAAFAEQFAAALSSRLVTYCRLSKTKTVTSDTLQAVAEELLGAGATTLPEGLDESRLPQTIIYSRFKRNLGGLRTDSKCASVAAIVGTHFLHYVRTLIDRVYAGAQDPRSVTVQQVIASLEAPQKYSPSGLPCLAYRHNDAIFAQAEAAAAAAAAEGGAGEESGAQPAKAKKGGKKAKAAAAEGEVAAAVPEAKEKPKKRARKEAGAAATEASAAAPEPVAVVSETKAKKARAPKKEAAAAAAAAPVAEAAEAAAPEAKKRRAPAKKATAAAATA